MSSDDLTQAVEAAFARFALVYGTQAMERMWRGQDLATVKRAWCHELRGFTSLDAIWAMEHLPPQGIPNLLEFKAACQRRPEGVALKLSGPKADPVRVERVVTKLNELKAALGNGSLDRARAWQAPLLERYARSDPRLTKFQRDICEELLGEQHAREHPNG
jgi:hypothetical protein